MEQNNYIYHHSYRQIKEKIMLKNLYQAGLKIANISEDSIFRYIYRCSTRADYNDSKTDTGKKVQEQNTLQTQITQLTTEKAQLQANNTELANKNVELTNKLNTVLSTIK
ncbi:hypothetical protein [Clostridium acetobutylicum]|uniref:hypothetical protein n=1 Tax=Clostridium acetobutylicum TaxID=1488 RepID=UPI001F4BD108|nr:hypothetical protein [Clostridium acetobutylicum]NRY56450.1 septal ring factor EnvC (AmiA/AmiB activator) [Clostridium acetobutylicum]